MRIIIPQRLTMAHGIRGGMETQAESLASGLVARGHDVTILTTPRPDGSPESIENTIPVRYLGPGTYRFYRRSWWERCYQEVVSLHQQRPVDLLLSQSAGGLGYIERVATDLNIPVVVIIHGSTTGELRTRWRGLWSVRGGIRMAWQLQMLPRLWLRWRRAARFVSRWVVVSRETAREWQWELSIPADRITVLPNGIDTTRFCPDEARRAAARARFGLDEEHPCLLVVGRLEQEKGVHKAISAVKQLLPRFPHLKLVIAGEGAYRQTLEHLAADVRHTVVFLGHVPNQELPDILAMGDLFLMPTLCNEAFPMTIIEAFASGVPVVASRIGGIPSAVEEGKTGLMVGVGDVGALARAIEQLLGDHALRTAMSTAAREAAISRFSRTHMIDMTERVVREVVEAHAPPSQPSG